MRCDFWFTFTISNSCNVLFGIFHTTNLRMILCRCRIWTTRSCYRRIASWWSCSQVRILHTFPFIHPFFEPLAGVLRTGLLSPLSGPPFPSIPSFSLPYRSHLHTRIIIKCTHLYQILFFNLWLQENRVSNKTQKHKTEQNLGIIVSSISQFCQK